MSEEAILSSDGKKSTRFQPLASSATGALHTALVSGKISEGLTDMRRRRRRELARPSTVMNGDRQRSFQTISFAGIWGKHAVEFSEFFYIASDG